MILKEEREQELYDAVADNIMNMRVNVKQTPNFFYKNSKNDLDEMLFQLELKIWKDVCKALNLRG